MFEVFRPKDIRRAAVLGEAALFEYGPLRAMPDYCPQMIGVLINICYPFSAILDFNICNS